MLCANKIALFNKQSSKIMKVVKLRPFDDKTFFDLQNHVKGIRRIFDW